MTRTEKNLSRYQSAVDAVYKSAQAQGSDASYAASRFTSHVLGGLLASCSEAKVREALKSALADQGIVRECMTNFCAGEPGNLDSDYCDSCIEDFRR